jgi:DNA repair exonuclease SbcCD ATPase subunit
MDMRTLEETKMSMEQWLFEETVKLEHEKRKCEEESKRLAQEKQEREEESKQLAQEKRECEEVRKQLEKEQRHVKSAQDQLKRDQSLFDKKWKLLEEEVSKLARDKDAFERHRGFYDRVHEYEKSQNGQNGRVLNGELFFKGVTTADGLKKRYKALLKIYHPDNVDGDSATLLEINKEYDRLNRMV